MNWIHRLKPDTLTKILFLAFFLTSALGVFLLIQMVKPKDGSFDINPVQADSTQGKWFNQPWLVSGANCRTEGVGCSRSEFKDFDEGSFNIGAGRQMLYCVDFVGGQRQSDGLYYGSWEAREYGCNASCEGRTGLQGEGQGTSCGNPFMCNPPVVTTPPPTPTAQPGSIRVNTVCTDGPTPSGSRVNLTVNVVRASDGRGLARETENVNIGSGMTVSVFDRNEFPVRANLDAQNITNGLRVSRNGCEGQVLNNGGSCTLEFSGCRVGTTVTPTPTRPTTTPTPTTTVTPSTPTPTIIQTPPPTPTVTVTPPPAQTPNVQILKTRISPDFQPVGSTTLFSITVRNTGNIDIRNFTLSDQFDPNYLDFISLTYKNVRINPDTPTGTMVNGLRRLTWSNMPPKSNQVPQEDGVLTVGETNTFIVAMNTLQQSSANNLEKNRNCGIVSTLQYRDNIGQTRQVTLNPPLQDCDVYRIPTQVPVNVSITKTTLTPSVVSPGKVRFRAVLTNNDTQRRTYTSINFTDVYETQFLKPSQVIITNPAGRQATFSNITNTGSIVANIGNSRVTLNGVTQQIDLGTLPYGQSFTFELVYDSMAPVTSTCDTVYANVVDNTGNGGTSNQARACAEITPALPPKTGANEILNLLLPGLVMILGVGANVVILKKY